LILYSTLTFAGSIILQVFYILYSRANFEESRYQWYFEKKYFSELLNYSGWNLFGNIAAVARNQGGNILLNIFFGPVLNAAYSLSSIVQGVVSNFVISFQTSINPQIVKNYANGNVELSHKLIFQSAKFSFFIMFVFVLPILYNLAFLLQLWLENFPPYTSEFIFFSILISLLECISNPLMNGLQATGKIKLYQVVVGSLIFLNLPIAWIVLKYSNDPIFLFYTIFCIGFLSLFFRLFFIRKYMDFDVKSFFKQVLFRILIVVIVVIILLGLLGELFCLVTSLKGFLWNSFIVLIISVFTIILFGLQKSERDLLLISFKTIFL
ncbi:MAG: hypothetical protein O9275_03900, partial [Microcystis sp. LE19-196.1B]|nr:hypothetical protein [Microcystis sp. LE19-196.1B]